MHSNKGTQGCDFEPRLQEMRDAKVIYPRTLARYMINQCPRFLHIFSAALPRCEKWVRLLAGHWMFTPICDLTDFPHPDCLLKVLKENDPPFLIQNVHLPETHIEDSSVAFGESIIDFVYVQSDETSPNVFRNLLLFDMTPDRKCEQEVRLAAHIVMLENFIQLHNINSNVLHKGAVWPKGTLCPKIFDIQILRLQETMDFLQHWCASFLKPEQDIENIQWNFCCDHCLNCPHWQVCQKELDEQKTPHAVANLLLSSIAHQRNTLHLRNFLQSYLVDSTELKLPPLEQLIRMRGKLFQSEVQQTLERNAEAQHSLLLFSDMMSKICKRAPEPQWGLRVPKKPFVPLPHLQEAALFVTMRIDPLGVNADHVLVEWAIGLHARKNTCLTYGTGGFTFLNSFLEQLIKLENEIESTDIWVFDTDEPQQLVCVIEALYQEAIEEGRTKLGAEAYRILSSLHREQYALKEPYLSTEDVQPANIHSVQNILQKYLVLGPSLQSHIPLYSFTNCCYHVLGLLNDDSTISIQQELSRLHQLHFWLYSLPLIPNESPQSWRPRLGLLPQQKAVKNKTLCLLYQQEILELRKAYENAKCNREFPLKEKVQSESGSTFYIHVTNVVNRGVHVQRTSKKSLWCGDVYFYTNEGMGFTGIPRTTIHTPVPRSTHQIQKVCSYYPFLLSFNTPRAEAAAVVFEDGAHRLPGQPGFSDSVGYATVRNMERTPSCQCTAEEHQHGVLSVRCSMSNSLGHFLQQVTLDKTFLLPQKLLLHERFTSFDFTAHNGAARQL